jgi:cell volume regulation protein A
VEFWNTAFLIGAGLLVLSIVASEFSARMGAPLLLVFIALGMLAGEDGPGGIEFDDFQVSYAIGTLALAVIIFDGGLRTQRDTFRVALWPAVSLATIGVLVTAALVGVFATWVLQLQWLNGLLLGAIVASTDAAAVFALLRNSGINLQQRAESTLEIESASNDPMAIFLTVTLLELIAAGKSQLEAGILLSFVRQFGIGTVMGLAGGRFLVWLINRLRLHSALYPLLAAAGGVLVFAATQQIGGSGFLAIFLAGLVLGNSQLQAAQNILRVHDGLAWLSQIIVFIILGLLVTPSELIHIALPALGIAAFLIIVARTVAVATSLAPFRFAWREHLFVSWVGLRGAVPIVLALFPLMYGVEHARLFFNVAFFIVLVSLLLQGWTIAPAARLLRLEVPRSAEPVQRVTLDMPGHFEHEIVSYEVQPGSLAATRDLAALQLPAGCQIVAVIRDGVPQPLTPEMKLQLRDFIHLLAQPRSVPQLNRLFDPHIAPDRLEEHRYFGDFVLNGDAVLGDVCAVYGIDVPGEHAGNTLAQYLDERSHGRVVVGDRAPIGRALLVVKELHADGRVSQVGLKLR